MGKPLEFDIDIDNAEGYDRTQGLPIGTFKLEIATLEQFAMGVDKNGDAIPGKTPGQAVSCKCDVVRVLNQTKTTDAMPKFAEEAASEYPPPVLVTEGERRAIFFNVKYEQNRQRLRHLV